MPLSAPDIEDGTGKATAVAFGDEAYVTAWWAKRGGSTLWAGASADEKMAGCVLATDYLCMGQLFDWRGTQHPTGRLAFPRIGASERNGNTIADNVVPWRVLDAMALLAPRAVAALRAGTTLLPPAERGGRVRSESAVGFSVTYADDAPSYTVQQDVLALVSVLLRDKVDAGTTELEYVALTNLPADNPALLPSTYGNPAAG